MVDDASHKEWKTVGNDQAIYSHREDEIFENEISYGFSWAKDSKETIQTIQNSTEQLGQLGPSERE